MSECVQPCLVVDRQPRHSPRWPPRCSHYTSIISIRPCKPADWQPKQSYSAAQHPARCPLYSTQQSAKCLQVYDKASKNTAWKNTVSHEISHPWNQPPRFTLRHSSVYFKATVGHTEGREQIRCESQWEEEASETNGVLRTSSSCVLLMVVSCLLQISVCWDRGDGWARPTQSPDTPLMSHSSLSKPAPSSCTATRWRVMDGLRLSYMQHRLPPRFIIKGDSHKTEHILWLKSIYFYFQTAGSYYLYEFFSLYFARSFHDFFFSLRDCSWKMLFASAQMIQEVGKGTRDRRERARRAECKENFFFFQDQPAYKSNPITSPWLCGIVGLNGVRRRRASSREHIVGW